MSGHSHCGSFLPDIPPFTDGCIAYCPLGGVCCSAEGCYLSAWKSHASLGYRVGGKTGITVGNSTVMVNNPLKLCSGSAMSLAILDDPVSAGTFDLLTQAGALLVVQTYPGAPHPGFVAAGSIPLHTERQYKSLLSLPRSPSSLAAVRFPPGFRTVLVDEAFRLEHPKVNVFLIPSTGGKSTIKGVLDKRWPSWAKRVIDIDQYFTDRPSEIVDAIKDERWDAVNAWNARKLQRLKLDVQVGECIVLAHSEVQLEGIPHVVRGKYALTHIPEGLDPVRTTAACANNNDAKQLGYPVRSRDAIAADVISFMETLAISEEPPAPLPVDARGELELALSLREPCILLVSQPEKAMFSASLGEDTLLSSVNLGEEDLLSVIFSDPGKWLVVDGINHGPRFLVVSDFQFRKLVRRLPVQYLQPYRSSLKSKYAKVAGVSRDAISGHFLVYALGAILGYGVDWSVLMASLIMANTTIRMILSKDYAQRGVTSKRTRRGRYGHSFTLHTWEEVLLGIRCAEHATNRVLKNGFVVSIVKLAGEK